MGRSFLCCSHQYEALEDFIRKVICSDVLFREDYFQLYGGWTKQHKIKSKKIRETGCCRSPGESDLDECSSNWDAQVLVDVKYIFELRKLSGFASFTPFLSLLFSFPFLHLVSGRVLVLWAKDNYGISWPKNNPGSGEREVGKGVST